MYKPSLWGVVVMCLCLICTACSGTPQPVPTTTPRPTATIPPQVAFEDARFLISYDGQVVAMEQIEVEIVEQGLLITSELRRIGIGYPQERRTLVLSRALQPLFYELELGTARAHSTWLAQRGEESLTIVANDLALPAPVIMDPVAPAPDVFMEAVPSALPYVLYALRLSEAGSDDLGQTFTYLDILDELPVTRAITLTQDSAQKAAVIGSTAFRAETEGQEPFVMWLRLTDRQLYHVEFERYAFHDMLVRTVGGLPNARMTIERVATFPEFTQAEQQGIAVTFAGTDDTLLAGRLYLPDGAPPYPCLVLHPAAGILPGWQVTSAALDRGFAVYVYDKPGLGESQGTFERGGFMRQARDALLAAAMLREKPEIGGRVVFVGVGEGALVGALASAEQLGYDAYVLAGTNLRSPTAGQTELAVLNALAKMHGWDNSQRSLYRSVTYERWKQWLFDGQAELDALGRRYDLRPLADYADVKPLEALARAQAPVLVLNGADSRWIDTAETESAFNAALNNPDSRVELLVIEGWDGLPDNDSESLLTPAADDALFHWLERAQD